jgi:glycerophosphoryl diester phosphodiesterase
MADAIASCSPGEQDLILLPEYSNAPGLEDPALMREFAGLEGRAFLGRMSREAERLSCLVAAGVFSVKGLQWVNEVRMYGPDGQEVFTAEKIHLTDVEKTRLGLSEAGSLRVGEIDGLRYGIAPCFDLYFDEAFAALAGEKVDILLCPSYQRSETGERICLQAGARALDTGAYVIRGSYAIEGSETGARSLVAAPDGTLLAVAETEPTVIRAEIDPGLKFVKPRSHGEGPVEHRVLMEEHRRPGLYRPATDRVRALGNSAFPKLCAHRGLSDACPENTLPAFAAALSLGVHEIELDLWLSRDGVPVVCHDPRLDRTTDGGGVVTEMDWVDIRRLDAGVALGECWSGVHVPRFEEVIELVDHRAGINIHIKDKGPDGQLVRMVCDLVRHHGLDRLAYIAGHAEDVLQIALDYAPDIERASLIGQESPETQVERAEVFRCRRIQFSRAVTAAHCQRARDAGILCNLFYAGG